MAWKKGDVVRLKSSKTSGPDMTVLDVSEDLGVLCWWFDKSGKLHKETFPDEALVEPASSNLTINFHLDSPPKETD